MNEVLIKQSRESIKRLGEKIDEFTNMGRTPSDWVTVMLYQAKVDMISALGLWPKMSVELEAKMIRLKADFDAYKADLERRKEAA